MKTVMTFLAAWSLPSLAMASISLSWSYNDDAGFGFYQPEGWKVVRNGRSSRLLGPAKDFAQSSIFFGSDWMSTVLTLQDLEHYLEQKLSGVRPTPIRVSGVEGFAIGNSITGTLFLLRFPQNVILVDYGLRGSEAQIREGRTALSSLQIRTKGKEY